MRLEVVVLPVADVDRATDSCRQQLGSRLDADSPFRTGFRVVRFTPRGSGGSIQFGTSMTSATELDWPDWYAAYIVAEQARTTLPI